MRAGPPPNGMRPGRVRLALLTRCRRREARVTPPADGIDRASRHRTASGMCVPPREAGSGGRDDSGAPSGDDRSSGGGGSAAEAALATRLGRRRSRWSRPAAPRRFCRAPPDMCWPCRPLRRVGSAPLFVAGGPVWRVQHAAVCDAPSRGVTVVPPREGHLDGAARH